MQLRLPARLSARRATRARPEPGTVVLGHRRVYVLPTTHGIGFALVLLVMLAGTVNYGLSLGFVLTFLLAALAINGMLYTFRNVAGLSLSPERTEPVFAGEHAVFPIRIENRGAVARIAIDLVAPPEPPVVFDVGVRATATVAVRVRSVRRGRLRPGRLTIESRFPLGLFRAWSYWTPAVECIVYPQPEPAGVPLPGPDEDLGDGLVQGRGTDDFAGLRGYQPSDSPKHIAWKADARTQALQTKLFSGTNEARQVWLDFDRLPATMDAEARLARLARWLLDAEAAGIDYGLRLPAHSIDPGSGHGHLARCLEALALHEDDAVRA